MPKLLIVFCKKDNSSEQDWWNNCGDGEKQISIENCQDAGLLFNDNVNCIYYKICFNQNDDVLILGNFYDTKFDELTITTINDNLKKAIFGFINCLKKENNIDDNKYEHLVLIHEESLKVHKYGDTFIAGYSLGGSSNPKKRGDILKDFFNKKKTISEIWEELKKNILTEDINLLAYRIAYLFLPIFIDWQGISNILPERQEDASEYYNEAFGNGGKSKLEDKIEQAKKLIEEFPGEEERKNCILEFLDNNERLEKIKNVLETWENTQKFLLKEEDLFHSWFCSLIECVEK